MIYFYLSKQLKYGLDIKTIIEYRFQLITITKNKSMIGHSLFKIKIGNQ